MDWAILLIGGLCEVGWLIAMKQSLGFTRLVPTAIMVAFMAASMGCLGLAVKTIPMGTAYAVWTGTSIAAVSIVGIIYFDEPATAARLVSIGFIFIGIVGLRLQS